METLPQGCISLPLGSAHRERIALVCDPNHLAAGHDAATFRAALAGVEGLLCSNQVPITAEMMDAAPRLRVISGFGVGYNNVDLDAATTRGIAVCNTPGVLTAAVADLTIGMIEMASRALVANAAYVRSGGWSRREPAPPLGWDLTGKTLGLIGFGRIGRAAAERARALGMNCIYFDTFTDSGPGFEYCTFRPLDDIFRECDVLSLHVNLTMETHHIVNARTLRLMKPAAWVINTSRGPVIDQPALSRALQANQIAGAVLDVLEVEPPDPNDPILTLDNAVILPHIGSATVETREAMLELAVANFIAVVSGQPPPECVNSEVLERALQRR